MFAFADMFHLFPDKFASLGGGRLAFALIFSGAFKGFFFRHRKDTRRIGYSDVQRGSLRWLS